MRSHIPSEISQNPLLRRAFERKVTRRLVAGPKEQRLPVSAASSGRRASRPTFVVLSHWLLQLSRQRGCLSPPTVRLGFWEDCDGGGGSVLGIVGGFPSCSAP